MMKEGRATPYYRMEVWDCAGPGSIHFDNASKTDSTLGYIVENQTIQCALHERMKQIPSIQIYAPTTIENIELGTESEWPVLTTKDGDTLSARLIIGADGNNSMVREMARIPTVGYSYNQKGVVATVAHSKPNDTAWQRFLPSGPIALLP